MEAELEQKVNNEENPQGKQYILHTFNRSVESMEKIKKRRLEKITCELCNIVVSRSNISNHNKTDTHRRMLVIQEIEGLANDKKISTHKQLKEGILEITARAKAIL